MLPVGLPGGFHATLMAWLGAFVLFAPARAAAAERVVFCEPNTDACTVATKLGQGQPRGWWAALDDAVLIRAARAGKRVPAVLYETKDAYQQAVAGLSGKDVTDAVLRRLKETRAGAAGAAPGCLFAAARQDMLNVIRAAGPADRAAVDGTLAAAVALAGGQEPLQRLSAADTLRQARESLARLRVELPEGPVAAGYAREAQRLTALLGRFRPNEARGAPFESPERAYFAADERPPARIDGELFVDRPWYAWRGGTVLVLRPSEAAEAPWKKRKLRLMYVDRASFYHDITSLTAAQMNQRLTARLKGAAPAQDLAALIARLAFEHAVFMRQATTVQKTDAAAGAAWAEAVALSTDNLRLAFRPADHGPSQSLKAALAELREDASLLAVLAHASPTPSSSAPLVDRFQAAVNALPR